MFHTTKIALGIRIILMAGVATTAFSSMGVLAADDEQAIEHIEVTSTGSRIVREGAYAPTPVTVISGKDLLATGATNIGEALNQLPALASTYSLANSGAHIGTAGLNILDLRGMGANRTLVLVNGKRHVGSTAGTGSVDTNSIPSQWVEKVEIITGGASAIYGADAVTGVVNFILKKNIEGLDISATKGWAADSDHSKERASFSYGTNFNNRGNFAIAMEYNGQNRLNSIDRSQTAISYYNMKNLKQGEDKNDPNNPDKIYTPNAGYYTLSEAGSFELDGHKTFDKGGGYHATDIGNEQYNRHCVNCETLNLKKYSDLQPEFKSYNFNIKTNYDISDAMNLAFEAKYTSSKSTSVGQPSFFFGQGTNPLKNSVIKIDNAYLDSSTVNLMHKNSVDSIVVSRFMGDLGSRIEDDKRNTQRYVLSLTGNYSDDWDYEVYGIYGQTDLERTNRNNMIMQNYQNALDAVSVDGKIVCRDAGARSAGCSPVNILGEGSPSDAARQYINTTSVGTSVIKQTVLGGTLTNSGLFELPAGYVGLSTGVEYRDESSEIFEPENAKGTFFNALGNDKGSFDVKEVFAEINVPLLSDLPLIRQLDADFAARYADYSTIGSATTWKAGLNWEISEDLRMRSTYAIAIRAPNISELYGAASQNFFRASDTCRVTHLATLDKPETRRSNCASLGVPADFDSSYDAKTLEGISSGNKELKPEESTSYTIGTVYNPSFIDNLTLSLDYWNIEITDAISNVSAQDIINRCIDSPSGIDNQYCKLITRDTNTHEITSLTQSVLNIASLDAEGIDLDIGYNFELLNGDVSTSLVATYLMKRRDFSDQTDNTYFIENKGVVGTPEWAYNFTANYTLDNVDVSWRTRFIDSVSLYDNNEIERNANPSDHMGNSTYFISDAGVAYNFDSGITIKVGVDNLFDRDLPFGTTGTGSGSASYDNVGRYVYTTASLKF